MKKSTLKKVFALMLALVLAFAMAVPAFAATSGDTYTVTITPGDYTDTSAADRFKAYEIFTGTLTNPATTDDEKNQLSNIAWGEDINVSALITELTKNGNAFNNAFNSITSMDASLQASAVAKILDNITHPEGNSAEAKATAEAYAKAFAIAAQASLKDVCTVAGEHELESEKSHPVASDFDGDDFTIGLENSGYYLIVDEYDGDENGDIISEHILQVVRDRDIEVKSDTPEVEKTIVTGNGGYEIGQTIKFQLVGTLAENFRNFTNDYQYKFIDTMSKGLTLDEDSIKVEVWTVDDGELEAKVDTITLTKGETAPDGNYTVSTGDGENGAKVITIAFDNLKEIVGLTKDHVIVVTYNAVINDDAEIGDPETNTVKVVFSNDPYNGGDGHTTETPEDKVAVETLELDIVKKDSVSDDELDGVEFILYKVETVEAEGPAPAEPTTETLYAVFDDTDADEGIYVLEGDSWTDDEDDATTLVTAAGGKLNLKGLGEGTYYLEEVKALDDYNALPGVIKIDIQCEYYTAEEAAASAGTESPVVEGELKTVTATYTIDGKTSALVYGVGDEHTTLGLIPIDILNIPISSVPSTGGIGNYIFYIGGGVLLIVAAIAFILVSKKKTVRG